MHDAFFEDVRTTNVAAHATSLATAFHEHGLVVLRGFLRAEPRFDAYVAELQALFRLLARKLAAPEPRGPGLRELITSVFEADNYYPRYIHDIGTHPMKLVSGNLLKYSEPVLALVRAIFG